MLNSNEITERFFHYYRHGKQKAIADTYGISHSSVSRWKNRREAIPEKHLERFLELEGGKEVRPGLKVSREWLLLGREEDASGPRLIPSLPLPSERIPVYNCALGDVHHSSPNPRLVSLEVVEEYLDPLPEGCCYMKVRGDSMAPVARDGQYALLAPDRRSALNGDLVVVSVHGAGIYIKRFFRLPDQDLVSLHSINPVIPIPPIVVPENRLDDLRVVIGIRFE